MIIDRRIADYLTTTTGGSVYKLQSVIWQNQHESQNRHHIYVDVLGDHGERLAGIPVTMSWADGESTGITEAKPGDLGGINFPMDNVLGSYGIRIGEPGESDTVAGMGMGTPDQPAHAIHTSFILTYSRGEYAEPEPEPEPEPPVEPPTPEPEPEPPPVTWAEISAKLDHIIALLEALPRG